MNDSIIYLDHAAGTPLDDRVLAAMEPWFHRRFANPSATYRLGREARSAVDSARKTIADMLHCVPEEIVFTSGGTESDAIAIAGSVPFSSRNAHIVTSAIEHAAVKDRLDQIEQKQDATVVRIFPSAQGILSASAVVDAVTKETDLVSIMYVNNEVGTIQDIAEMSVRIKEKNSKAIIHTDACQAPAFLNMNVQELGVDLLSMSASKIYGPVGVGALFVKKNIFLEPFLYGGGQEKGIRPGSENVAGIVGFAKALELAQESMISNATHVQHLRDRLEKGVQSISPKIRINGDGAARAPHISNIFFPDVTGEVILFSLDAVSIASSLGSACAAGSLEASYVLRAMGLSYEEARQSVRFSLGHTNTKEEIDFVIEQLHRIIKRKD